MAQLKMLLENPDKEFTCVYSVVVCCCLQLFVVCCSWCCCIQALGYGANKGCFQEDVFRTSDEGLSPSLTHPPSLTLSPSPSLPHPLSPTLPHPLSLTPHPLSLTPHPLSLPPSLTFTPHTLYMYLTTITSSPHSYHSSHSSPLSPFPPLLTDLLRVSGHSQFVHRRAQGVPGGVAVPHVATVTASPWQRPSRSHALQTPTHLGVD